MLKVRGTVRCGYVLDSLSLEHVTSSRKICGLDRDEAHFSAISLVFIDLVQHYPNNTLNALRGHHSFILHDLNCLAPLDLPSQEPGVLLEHQL